MWMEDMCIWTDLLVLHSIWCLKYAKKADILFQGWNLLHSYAFSQYTRFFL